MTSRLPDSSEESLNLVRRRILAITWVVTAIHGLFGTLGGAWALGSDRRGDQIILLVVSVPLAFIIFGVTRVILDKKVFTWRSLPFLLVLLVPTVAAFFVLL
ncbi:hypothetical protein [Aeromicrobium duanguangcaii]|uniref:Uncharacterized protein n=1 Tax=Aeromicrobium duanguangcaii TaxID=2968086 RepID=A0ABY5KG79_9ACTN|nr:hypothetical protein [Aeromicrobium duanguangcaii]MCD9153603.1 hypothetical protein [Aeromicrobium duanguangcaii]MCL3836412.1 hypothetical protein [Aeromicrobium duanguangcaii]UUI69314.1 hypothetical protein NP095_04185 [Aeromicrobium duanguangcaii]